MDTIKSVYKRAGIVISKHPWRSWGVVLLASLIVFLAKLLSGTVPLLGIAFEVLVSAAVAIIFIKCLFAKNIEVEDIFAACRDWNTAKHVLGGMLWSFLWVLLWSLIPIVGIVFGIIRSYEYQFVPYILMLEPEISAKDAIKVSKERTNGLKEKMFWADVLAVAAMVILAAILFALSTVRGIGWLFAILFAVALLAWILVVPFFMGLVRAIFFVDEERARKGSSFYVEPEVRTAENSASDGKTETTRKADKFCPACGAPMNAEDVFCAACGAKFTSDFQAESSEAEPDIEVEIIEDPADLPEEIAENVKDEIQECVENHKDAEA